MLNIAICDDEALHCQRLKDQIGTLLSGWDRTFQISCYGNALQLLASPLDQDLLFLDIRMPGLDGMSLARRLRTKGFNGILVFATVLTEYMSDAFEVDAADYLCKPIDKARLERTLDRSLKRLEERPEPSLFIRTASWCRSIRLSQIYYCEVINRKIYLHTKEGVFDHYGRMKDLEQQLGGHFIQCQRSFVINPEHLSSYAGGQVTLTDGSKVPVSRKYHQLLMDQMLRYMDGRDAL